MRKPLNIKESERKSSASGLALFIVAFLAIFFLLACVKTAVRAQSTDNIQEDINALQKKIEKEQAAKQSLESNLSKIQQSVYLTQTEINKTTALINEVKQIIGRKDEELAALDKKAGVQKDLLGNLVREMYYNKKEPMLQVVLAQNNLSQMLGNVDYVLSLEERMALMIKEIENSKGKIEEEKAAKEDAMDDHEKLLAMKSDQKQALIEDKVDTQSEIYKKEATIGQLQSKIAKLRGELSQLLGKSYNAKDIEDAAGFAAGVTGVRKDFLLGMLVVESDLGRFTGGCTFKESRMSGTRAEIFKNICKELVYDYRKKKVSCPPKSYKGTGGAMGVAQFMPDTWIGYKSSIASVTSHNPPDPWSLTDGVTAMGLKLARGGATKRSGECNAAKLYLSGTTSSKYNWYCQRVFYWADNYERLLD